MTKQYATLALNADGDIGLDASGNLLIVYGTDAIIQNVQSAIRLWRGEYEFDTTIGVNYKLYLGGLAQFATANIEYDLRRAILSIQGVTRVTSITYDYNSDTNALSGTAVIDLTNQTGVPITF